VFYNELMSDFEMDEKDFEADSWSLAVDSSFLQQHKKEVMKKQDVIYGMLRPLWFPCTCLLIQALLT
jgi:Rho guanine nucleotide exchange factor 2